MSAEHRPAKKPDLNLPKDIAFPGVAVWDRREFLKLAGIATAAYGLSQLPGIIRPIRERINQQDRVYGEGEVIPHLLAPTVVGWSVFFDSTRIADITDGKSVHQITYQLLSPKTYPEATGFYAQEFTGMRDPEVINPDGEPRGDSPRRVLGNYPVSHYNLKGNEGTLVGTLPVGEDNYAILQIKQQFDDPKKAPVVDTFSIKLGRQKNEKEENDAFIFSETQVPEGTTQRLQRLQDAHPFSFYPYRTYILDSKKYPSGVNPFPYAADTSITLGSDLFNHREYHLQGDITLFHATALKSFRDNDYLAQYKDGKFVSFNNAHTTFRDAVERVYPEVIITPANPLKLPKGAKKDPYVRAFDDIFFEEQKGTRIEHPHYPFPEDKDLVDPDVLFASALTTFEFYPKEFVHNLSRLSTEQRTNVVNLTGSIIDLAYNIRSDKGNREPVAAFERIKSALQI